jgi:nucleoside-diphosphate-sugar epimerase
MPAYLVTGAAGFIASRVCELLLAEGHAVVGVDNLNDYYDVRLKDYRLARLLGAAGRGPGSDPRRSVHAGLTGPLAAPGGRFVFHHLDIEDRAVLDRLFAAHRFDAVFNLAARAGVRYSVEHPELYLATNVAGTLNVLECQRRHGVRKLVLASSSSVYTGSPLPFAEDQPVNTPQSPYAATKKAAELLAASYHQLHGLDVSVVRYFTVFGPAGRPDMAPLRFIKWIDEGRPIMLYGDGSQARDFTYLDDIARGTVLAAKPLGYEILNLGGGRNPLTMRAVIALIEQALGRKATIAQNPAQAADLPTTWADIAKAGRLLGWKPEVSPAEGFRRTVEWHVANRSWLADLAV